MTVIITTLAAVLIFGIVVFVHELGHFICAKKAGIQVNEFSIGMGPALFSKMRKGTKYSVRLLPIGGYVSMEGEDEELDEEQQAPNEQNFAAEATDEAQQKTGLPFPDVKVYKRAIVIAAGAIMNLILGYLVLLAMFAGQDVLVSKTIAKFEDNARPMQTGLQVEDTIVAINGRRCFVANDIFYELSRSANLTADFTVRRDGQVVQVQGVQFDAGAEEGSMELGFKVHAIQKTPMTLIKQAGNYTVFYARLVFRSLVDLVTGNVSITDLSGPVGIVSAINEAAKLGLEQVLSLMALLTINLGVFNLLPFPALDGGKLVFLVYEGIFRKPIPKRFEILVNMVGIVCLFGLMIFATVNDIGRLF